MSLAIVTIPLIYGTSRLRSKTKLLLLTVLTAFILALSLGQPHTDASLQKFQPLESFWPETLHCFSLGILGSAVASIILAFVILRFFPAPNRFWRIAFSGVASLCGLTLLTYHCMGPLYSHIFLGHWAQGLLLLPFSYFLQRKLFLGRVRPVLAHRGSLNKLTRL
jgi:hypothetical protein